MPKKLKFFTNNLIYSKNRHGLMLTVNEEKRGESNPDGFFQKTSGLSDECRWGHAGFWEKTRFDLRGGWTSPFVVEKRRVL